MLLCELAGSRVQASCDCAACGNAGPFAKDIAPQGATLVYAAPEVLQFLQLHHERAGSDDVGTYIDGPAADFWSVGILLFELLTGEVPFDSKDSLAAGSTPARVRSGHESRWAGYEAMLQLL